MNYSMITTTKGTRPLAHVVDRTNANGSIQTLCGVWGRDLGHVQLDPTDERCKRCAKLSRVK